MKRRALLWALAAGSAVAAPPAENLRVELRAVRDGALQATQGGVTVGTRGGTPAVQGSVTVRTDRAGADEVQSVLVLNGAQATLHVARLQALPTGDWVWGGRSPGVAQTRQWVDAGAGFTVQPRWPGGDTPVTVEIAARGRTAATTTLVLPLGEWQTFASADDGVSATALQLRVRRNAP